MTFNPSWHNPCALLVNPSYIIHILYTSYILYTCPVHGSVSQAFEAITLPHYQSVVCNQDVVGLIKPSPIILQVLVYINHSILHQIM